MRFKRLLKIIGFFVTLIPFSSVACNRSQSSHYTLSPKYILNGTQSGSADGFTYYLLSGGDSYAVGLTESAKADTGAKVIPSEYNSKPVTGIWRNGFANSNCSSITIPNGITVIDYEAFIGSKITTLNVPSTVEQIGEAAFYACKKLTKAVFTNSSTSSSESSSACSCVDEVVGSGEGERQYSNLRTIPSFCFFSCSGLKELLLPQNIEEIEYEAFNGCKELFSTLTFMNIKTIRSRAFQNCTKLTKVYLSSSFFEKDGNNVPVGIMEEHAFSYCHSNLTFYLVGSEENINAWLGLARNVNWNWKNDRSNPALAANRYAYVPITSGGGASYSNDWIYTTALNGDVTITSYIGPTTIDDVPIKFITFPDELPSGSGHKVRAIEASVFETTVKNNLERVYLPKYLGRIESQMFDTAYTKLTVVDVNTTCSTDESYLEEHNSDLTPRIVLNALTELQVIDNRAFVYMPKLEYIQKLYLPYSLVIVGSRAFGGSGDSGIRIMRRCTDFKWYYNETLSALKAIGREAFYKLGKNDPNKDLTALENNTIYDNYIKSDGSHRYNLTTLVFPRTFEHFGITSDDKNNYSLSYYDGESNSYPVYSGAFAGCPLLEKVVFKGNVQSEVTNNTTNDNVKNLCLGTKTFACNESLRTVVFEERVGRKILFHTNGGEYSPCIGWSAGKAKNDFSGDPALQTLVLPNYRTSIYVQDFAFQGNSRGVIYLTAGQNNQIFGTTQATYNTSIGDPANSSNAITNGSYSSWQWRTIGNEDFRKSTYPGYCFATNKNNQSTHTQNSYDLNQKMPIYANVVYNDTINESYASTTVTVAGTGTNEFVVAQDAQGNDKFAFICNSSNKATLTKYLYDRYNSSFNGTAVVPATVNKASGTSCQVNKIGDSAFSAAYCDSYNYVGLSSTFKDLTTVNIPSTVATIGEYAFMRAYGVTEVTAYNASTGVSLGQYVMPTSLTSIGKHAFAFCNVVKVLNIPNSCVFYENTNSVPAKTTSIFSNNFSLRRVSFGNDSDESTNYKTTTYTHYNTSDVYTSAIYSKDTSALKSNKNSLLLVLYRDSSDCTSVSADLSKITGTPDTNEFDAWYSGSSTTAYLYGAYKMGYWIDALNVGSANALASSINQPLISGVYDFNNDQQKLVYLNEPVHNFINNDCNLKSIVFNSLTSVPPYSFEGCEQLTTIRLPRDPLGTTIIPEGLFAYLENDDVIFEVPTTDVGNGAPYTPCSKGELDLTHTNYAGIAANAFKNTSIKEVVAPIKSDFTIGSGAFDHCEDLESIDFSNVTASVTFNGSFTNATIHDDLFTWSSTATVSFGPETFKEANFIDGSFSFPAKTIQIGKSCFESAANLSTVTADGDLDDLTEIENLAFFLCDRISNFDFSKFTALERIGHYAFGMRRRKNDNVIQPDNNATSYTISNTTTICPGGVVVLPATITNLGVGAFFATKITSVTIQSSHILFERGKTNDPIVETSWNTGGFQFCYCPDLTKVYFSNANCVWDGIYIANKTGQDNYYSYCSNLTEVYLPKGYSLQNNTKNSTIWLSERAIFYTYFTLNETLDIGNPTNDWRKRNSNNVIAPIVYYVTTSADMLDASFNYRDTGNQTTCSAQFWTRLNDGTIIKLGTPTGNDGAGNVTFEHGYTLTPTGLIHS